MRALFVNRMLAIERGGGETFDLEIARHLRQLGGEPAFLVGRPLLACRVDAKLFAGFSEPPPCFAIRSPSFHWFPWDKVRGGWRVRVADFWMFEQRAARWILRREGAWNVIQVCELPTLVAELKRGGTRMPIVMRVTAPNLYDPAGGLALANAVIASGTTVGVLRAGARPDCVDIPNAVDAELFRPQPSSFRKRHGLAEEAFVILYVARFQAFKNHELLVQAFSRVAQKLPHAYLVLVGKGPLLGKMRRLARGLGVGEKVLFLGEVPYAEMPTVYAAASVKVVASTYESFSFAALEAMATGLPVVTTDCGWVPELLGRAEAVPEPTVEGERWRAPGGFIVRGDALEALAGALVAIAERPAEAAAMGDWNRRRAVRDFAWRESAERLWAVWKGLAKLA